MPKRSLLAIAPILPLPNDLKQFSNSLSFLESEVNITWIDPLQNKLHLSKEAYLKTFKRELTDWVNIYDGFIGFAFGAILLQHHLDLFDKHQKKIILISPPSHIEIELSKKLNQVLMVAKSGDAIEAMQNLHDYIYPSRPYASMAIDQPGQAVICERLIYGLSMVLSLNFPAPLLDIQVAYLQIIGERSNLVRAENLIITPNSVTKTISNAGMRVLEDNPDESQSTIKEWLYEK